MRCINFSEVKKQISLLVTIFFMINIFSQTETFDIATFTRPKGWQRLDTNG